MKFFRDLKLRSKLILSFAFLALLISVLAFTLPQFSIDRLTEQSVPFLDLTGQVAASSGAVQREILEYMNSGETESLEEFDEIIETLREAVSELTTNFAGLMSAGDLAALEGATTELISTGQTVIASHRDTLASLEQLEQAENTLEGMHADEHNLTTDEGRELLHEISEIASGLQLEAIEYMTSGEDETLAEFEEYEAEFQEKQASIIMALLAVEPDAADFITTFGQVAGQMAAASRTVVDNHSESLKGMENVEALEGVLKKVLARTSDVARDEIDSSETEVRINFMISVVVMLVLATVFGIVVTRGIVKPIDQLSAAAQQIGAGDLSVRAEVTSRDEIGQLAQVFNQMAGQLQQSFTLAEQQSTRRIQELEVTADISRQLTTILDVDQALHHVVSQIQQSFGYYHVHIYLTDLETGELVMREGSGDAGEELRAHGHRLLPGQGIVGQAAGNIQPLLVPDVDDMPDFVRNPLLPKTQSELAVPLRKGTQVLGVLDIQSEEVGGFDDEDLTLMQTIADQVAVVIDNARLFRETQRAVAEAETLGRRLTLAKWSDISERTASGYVFTKSGVAPVALTSPTGDEESWLPIMSEAIKKKELSMQGSAPGSGNGGDQNSLSIPLMLRDQVIGVIGIERSALAGAEDGSVTPSASMPWSEDELTAVRQITEQVTLALDSARLAQETQRAAWRDRLVSESTAQVWATDEIEDVMRAAVEQLGDRLQASEVVIRLGKEDDLQSE